MTKNICENYRKTVLLNLTEDRKAILNSINYTKQTKKLLVKLIKKYIEYNIDFSILAQNWNDIQLLGRDSSSKSSFITRYGVIKGTELFDNKNSMSVQNKEKLVAKYGDEKAKELLSSRGASLKNYIMRHGEDMGKIKWNEYCEKRKATYARRKKEGHVYTSTGLQHYIKLYGEEEGIKRFNEKMAKHAFASSLDGYIAKYGPIDGPVKMKNDKDHSSEDYFIEKYGHKDGNKKYQEYCKKMSRRTSLEGYIDRYGIEGEKLWEDRNKKISRSLSLDGFIEKYGDDGENRWNKWLERLSHRLGIDYYNEKYGPEQGPIEYNNRLSRLKFSRSKDGYISRYGKEDGEKLFQEYQRNLVRGRSIDGYIDRYGPDDGPKKYNDKIEKFSRSLTLDGFIQRYGPDEGTKKYAEYRNNLVISKSEFGFIKKYGEEEGKKKFKEVMEKWKQNQIHLNGAGQPSKWSIEICKQVSTLVPDLYYYGDNEIFIRCDGFDKLSPKQKCVRPDVFYYGKIIEFNGDFWHANPSLYEADDSPVCFYPNITAKDIWSHDAAKVEFYESRGYTVLTIWESDYYNDKKGIIELCANFLRK